MWTRNMTVVNSVLFEDEITNKKRGSFQRTEVNESIGRGLILRHGHQGIWDKLLHI